MLLGCRWFNLIAVGLVVLLADCLGGSLLVCFTYLSFATFFGLVVFVVSCCLMVNA